MLQYLFEFSHSQTPRLPLIHVVYLHQLPTGSVRPFYLSELLEEASSSEIIEIYENNTAEAQKAGVFGAPSFEINGEIFWGDDRLEDAIRFARQRQ